MDRNAWDARYAAADGLVWSAEPNRFVVRELAGLAPGRALDIAAGEGRNSVWLAERGWQVTALDFSSVALNRGRELAAQRGVEVTWVEADVCRYPLPEAAFDLVLVAYLQLPADDLAGVLRRAAGALAPGGRLLVVGHDRTNLTEGVGGPQDPARLYTPDEVVAALNGLLRVHLAETATRPVVTEGGTATALDTVVVAVRP